MSPIEPIVPGVDLPVTVIAKDQPQYIPLPAFISEDGEVITRWKLNWKERFSILFYGNLWLRILTFGRSLQPVHMSTEAPKFEVK